MELKRRQFTREASLAFLAGVSVVVTDCGGGGGGGGDDGYGPTTSTSTPPSTVASGSKVGTISSNHGHQAVITSAELQAGGEVRIDIAYQAGHSHMVDLPSQAIVQIRDGAKVAAESTMTDAPSVGAHTHMVTFNSETPGDPYGY
jgi:hypothetical protein